MISENLKKLWRKIEIYIDSFPFYKMILPVRCFTCNKILGHFSDYLEEHKVNEDFFRDNDIQRYCCKKILISSVDIHKHLYGKRNNSYYRIKKYSELKKIVIAR